jgi:hypothetical protein
MRPYICPADRIEAVENSVPLRGVVIHWRQQVAVGIRHGFHVAVVVRFAPFYFERRFQAAIGVAIGVLCILAVHGPVGRGFRENGQGRFNHDAPITHQVFCMNKNAVLAAGKAIGRNGSQSGFFHATPVAVGSVGRECLAR